MKGTVPCLFVTVLALAWLSGRAQARVEVEPRVLVQQEYNDNIYLEDRDPESDFITTVSPGLRLAWLTRILHLDLDYGLYFRKYRDHGEEDETSLADIQRGRGTAVLFPDGDFSLLVQDEYSRVPLDVRDPVVEENLLVNQTHLNRLVVKPRLRYRPSATFAAVLDYRFERLTYDERAGDDSRVHGAGLELQRDFSRHFGARLEYALEHRDNKWSDDYLRQALLAGIRWQFGRQGGFQLLAGPLRVDFADGDEDDSTILGGELSCRLGLSRRLGATLRGAREFAIATVDGLFERRVVEAGFAYGPAAGAEDRENRLQAELTLSWTGDDYIQIEREDESLGTALAGRLPLGRFLALLLTASYANMTFDPEGEKVDRFGCGGTLEYRLRRLLLTLGYLFRESDSNLPGRDYRNHLVSLAATFEF